MTGETPDWLLELWEEGDDAHKTLQAHNMGYPNLIPEAHIPSGLEKGNGSGYSTPSGTGRADYLYYNPSTGIVEVYELKHDSSYGRTRGPVQLDAYIKAINNNKEYYGGYQAVAGYSINQQFNCCCPSLKYPGRTIYYYTDPSQRGMIYWSYENPERQPKLVPYTVPQKDEFEVPEWLENMGYVIGGIGLVALAIALFADDAVGGFADDGVAVGFLMKAAEWFSRVAPNCSYAY